MFKTTGLQITVVKQVKINCVSACKDKILGKAFSIGEMYESNSKISE